MGLLRFSSKASRLALLIGAIFQTPLVEMNEASDDTEKLSPVYQTLCPDPDYIYPCKCSIMAPWGPDLNCSPVRSEEELRNVFNRTFEDHHLHFFTVQNNGALRHLEAGTFGDVTFKSFFFTKGTLEAIEPNVFLGSRGFLQYLTLTHQNLRTFPFEEIRQYGVLRTLSVEGNRFSAFPTLQSSTLENLDLSSNPISDIPVDGLKSLPNLYDFTCGDCGLTEIHPGTFTGFRRLSGLILRSNNLTHLPENMVQSDYYMVGVHVENNQISNVSAGAFTLGEGQKININLADNRLEQLEERVWRPYFEGGLTFLYAEGNPFSCGCEIAWLVTNSEFMGKLGGAETCQDGRLLQTLDPSYYEEMC
ncbi:oplophorus-luciferin 2-monooxygenase non-catalytic subunit-like [Palaemon carinicauda]|uniref:oplophorus-luciferin 2-monooxygenase non-catalytic subunit-like n=1 Tax=Palaemon carinicauda TaxID=392227 RepID=UPI0035B5A975